MHAGTGTDASCTTTRTSGLLHYTNITKNYKNS